MTRLGVWMVGAYGGIATTLVVGARAIAAGLCSQTGLATAEDSFAALDLVPVPDIVFGGVDLRATDYPRAAREIAKASGSLDLDTLDALRDELAELSEQVSQGTSVSCGAAISTLLDPDLETESSATLRDEIARLRKDIDRFRSDHDLKHVVVVNLASTEPDLPDGQQAEDLAALEKQLDRDERQAVRPSLLYAYAAFMESCAFLNFTPSAAALSPALRELADTRGLPYMGNDGKTGETLVKSALAPMFKHRQLKVLSWQGYNILGDRDGQILSHDENLASKVRSKDSVLANILGYELHTHVGIDYVPSIDDRKTAWDHIHFSGFLDHKMTMQFTWQGCDAILAAPLVLDMVRLAEHALLHKESGAMRHLAAYFKSPLEVSEQDLHEQVRSLAGYVADAGSRSD